VLTRHGAIDLAVPRDRNGTFEEKIVRKAGYTLFGRGDRLRTEMADMSAVRDACT
jgi:hypothetical protein